MNTRERKFRYRTSKHKRKMIAAFPTGNWNQQYLIFNRFGDFFRLIIFLLGRFSLILMKMNFNNYKSLNLILNRSFNRKKFNPMRWKTHSSAVWLVSPVSLLVLVSSVSSVAGFSSDWRPNNKTFDLP